MFDTNDQTNTKTPAIDLADPMKLKVTKSYERNLMSNVIDLTRHPPSKDEQKHRSAHHSKQPPHPRKCFKQSKTAGLMERKLTASGLCMPVIPESLRTIQLLCPSCNPPRFSDHLVISCDQDACNEGSLWGGSLQVWLHSRSQASLEKLAVQSNKCSPDPTLARYNRKGRGNPYPLTGDPDECRRSLDQEAHQKTQRTRIYHPIRREGKDQKVRCTTSLQAPGESARGIQKHPGYRKEPTKTMKKHEQAITIVAIVVTTISIVVTIVSIYLTISTG